MKGNKVISDNMKTLRNKHNLTQSFVASKLGITQHYYSQIENGHRSPQMKHLPILRELYSVSLDDIFFDEEIAKCDSDNKVS